MGCPNPCKLEQKLECTFLKPFIQVKIKWASKEFSIYAIQSYQLHSKADSAHQGWIGLTAWLVTLNGIGEKLFWRSFWFYIGKRFQKNALPFLFQFARVRAAHQLLVTRDSCDLQLQIPGANSVTYRFMVHTEIPKLTRESSWKRAALWIVSSPINFIHFNSVESVKPVLSESICYSHIISS